MKSLPNEFPIRYAILVSDHHNNDIIDDFELSRRNSLWSQLIDFIKIKPLDVKDLYTMYTAISYEDQYENKLCVIPKLGGTKEWANQAGDNLRKFIPTGTFGSSYGSAFQLTLYSYTGMIQIPLFWKIMNYTDENKEQIVEELKLREVNYYFIDGLKPSVKKKYNQIMNTKTGLWENFSNLKQPPVFYVNIPYSKLWKALDEGNENGIVCFNNTDSLNNLEKIIENKGEETKKFITVAIAKDLESLMTEEMVALYKASSICNCCSKPLPFDYNGKYCPDIRENIDCIRKRARQRKKKF